MAVSEKIGEKEPEKEPPAKESKPSGSFSFWVRGEEAWKASQMPRDKRGGLEEKLFGPEGYSPKKASEILQDFEKAPDASLKKYGFKDRTEREQARKILERYSGQ
jgi:hypothetical protein